LDTWLGAGSRVLAISPHYNGYQDGRALGIFSALSRRCILWTMSQVCVRARSGSRSRRAAALVAVALAASLVSRPSVAGDDRKKACIAASERAQRLRLDGKLAEARTELLTCGASDCPSAVRADCINWLAQVTELMPSIVVIAHDERGEDVGDVKVFIDGEPLTEKIDGKAIPVPTGEHVLRFERKGSMPIGKKIIVHEGEAARRVEITFTPDPGKGTQPATQPTPTTTPAEGPRENEPAPPPRETEHSSVGAVLPWLVVAAGVVALSGGITLFVIGSNNFPAGCNTGECDNRFDGSHSTLPVPTVTGGASSGKAAKDVVNNSGQGYVGFPGTVVSCQSSTADGCAGSSYNTKRQADAGTYSGMKVGGTLGIVTGAVLVAGGLTWYFLQRPSKKDSDAGSAFFSPFIGDRLAGAGFVGRF
jgi:hypothetical protein